MSLKVNSVIINITKYALRMTAIIFRLDAPKLSWQAFNDPTSQEILYNIMHAIILFAFTSSMDSHRYSQVSKLSAPRFSLLVQQVWFGESVRDDATVNQPVFEGIPVSV